jgi:hypothetical protein
MFELKDEFDRKEKNFKTYLFLFVISVLIHTFTDFYDLGIERVSKLRVVINLLFYGVILYFGLRRKLWAEVLIKFFVWVNIILLIIILTVTLVGF